VVWIIILNWNGWRDTTECLRSLKHLQPPDALREELIHIVVVDNGSTDESREKFRSLERDPDIPSFELIETGQNLGFGGGNNVAMRRALERGARWILLLNNDTIVTPDFLRILLARGKEDSKIGMLNPKIYVRDRGEGGGEKERLWFVGGKLNLLRTKGEHIGYGEEDHGQYDGVSVRDTEYATGCCLLVRRETIEDIGLLPEHYFLYYEDAEWSIRARRRGWRCVVVPEARIFHKGAASSAEGSSRYIRYHVRNGLLFCRRVGNPLQIGFAYALTIPRMLWQLFKILSGGPKERLWAFAILRGIADAWAGKTGPLNE
jgi:hypothetical protein